MPNLQPGFQTDFFQSPTRVTTWAAPRGAGKTFGILFDWFHQPAETISLMLLPEKGHADIFLAALRGFEPALDYSFRANRATRPDGARLYWYTPSDFDDCAGFCPIRVYADDFTVPPDEKPWLGLLRQAGAQYKACLTLENFYEPSCLQQTSYKYKTFIPGAFS